MSDNRNKRIEAAARALVEGYFNSGVDVWGPMSTLRAALEPDPDDRTALEQAYARGRADERRVANHAMRCGNLKCPVCEKYRVQLDEVEDDEHEV